VKRFFIRYVLSFSLLLALHLTSFSQSISSADKRKLEIKEDSLKVLAKDLITDSIMADRMRSDSLFVRTLIRALQIKNSFYYPFDSVIGMMKDEPLQRFLRRVPSARFEPATGPATLCAVAVETQPGTGLAARVAAVRLGGGLEQATPGFWA